MGDDGKEGKRFMGLVVMPGEHIVKFEVQDNHHI
jgi:hypothetical protein